MADIMAELVVLRALSTPDTVLVPRACCCHAAGVMYFRYSSQTLKVRVHA